jgi:hypothetical protein
MDMSDQYWLRYDNSPDMEKSCIDLFIERLDFVLSDFSPDICPWADIAVALPL